MKKFAHWLALCVAASFLAACGGGGGSPGANSNGTTPSKAASIVLTSSAATIASSGAAGTEVTLTAIVKNSSNAALANEAVSFKTSSGNIAAASATTDANGVVTAKLNVQGDSSLRAITVTASDSGVTSNAVTINVVSAVQTLSLTTDSGTLPSAGVAGSEVTVVALVRDASNSVVPGVTVTLAADSGSLTNTSRVTDAKGMVTEKLSTGGDPTSRAIKLTASVSNAPTATAVVNVAGTALTISAPSNINVGASADVTVTLVNSAGNALAGRPVTFSSNLNSLTVKGSGGAVTNAVGQLILSYTASKGPSDVISVSSTGVSATSAISVNTSSFALVVQDRASGVIGGTAFIGSCPKVLVSGAPTSNVSVSTSLGTVYNIPDPSAPAVYCATALTGFIDASNVAYVDANSPGVATLTAGSGGQTVQGTIEFVAPLTSTSIVSVQSNPGVLAANTAGSTTQQATLRAVVRDGTAQNNLVKNTPVVFSIVSGAAGGSLTQPAVATTGSDGSATVNFIAGPSATPLDGVVIQAQIQRPDGSFATGKTTLTVAQKSLFITAGTGNTVQTPTTQTYQLDYAIIVSDAAGNAVPGVKLTASVVPQNYYKGRLIFPGTTGPWQLPFLPFANPPAKCANEDTDHSGLLTDINGVSKDTNGNHMLDPGIPVTVTTSVTTDANGQATVSLVYPRDRAYWVDINLTIRGQVSGTESSYMSTFLLPGLSTDYASINISPPGLNSPYGTASVCTNPN